MLHKFSDLQYTHDVPRIPPAENLAAPVRHGRLFELLRHDATGDPTEEDLAARKPSKAVTLSDDEMLALRSLALQSLLPRKI